MTYTQAPAATDAHPLDRPYYGVGPLTAVKRLFQNYAVFSGRASRSEYWWANLAYFVVVAILGTLGTLVGAATSTVDAYGQTQPGPLAVPIIILMAVVGLGTVVPFFAVTFRRLHDANFSGYLILLGFVPFGSLVLLVFSILPAQPAGARFDKPRV